MEVAIRSSSESAETILRRVVSGTKREGERTVYLFRDEYIFELPRVIVVETAQLGHATYLFSKPQSTEAFLAAYAATTKEAIRQNRANVAERLGFLCRVVHGSDPRIWLRSLGARLGEAADSPEVASERE